MKKINYLISTLILLMLSACAQFSQTTQKALSGLSVKSDNLTDEEVEEDAHSGQMRNIH